jgi:hypothetical protein
MSWAHVADVCLFGITSESELWRREPSIGSSCLEGAETEESRTGSNRSEAESRCQRLESDCWRLNLIVRG